MRDKLAEYAAENTLLGGLVRELRVRARSSSAVGGARARAAGWLAQQRDWPPPRARRASATACRSG